MSTLEIEKRICQVHKLEIVAVDLKPQTRMDDKYLCTRCLAEKVDKENMALFNEATEMIQSMKTQSLRLAKEENVLRLMNLKQLQSSMKSYKNQIETELGKLLQLIDQQMEQLQLEIEAKESKLEIKNYDEEIQILSKNYIGNFSYNVPKQQAYKESELALVEIIYESLQSQQNSKDFNQIMEFIKVIRYSVPINQSASINQIYVKEFDQHKTPYLNQICNKHNKEIIMLNINQNEPEFGRLACVECIEENPIQYVSLKEANKRWNQFMGQSKDLISKHNCKREEQFNMVVQEMKELKDYYNEQLSEMIKTIEEQLIKNKQDIQDFIKLENKQIFELDEQQVDKMMNVLSQKDQNWRILEQQKKQNRLDQLFYQNIKYKLDSLIKNDLLCQQQLMKILSSSNSNQFRINDPQEDISPEIHEFIQKCQLQEQYLNIFNESVILETELLKESERLMQQGQLNQIFDQEDKDDTELPINKFITEHYKQFKINSKKMQKMIMVDETVQQLTEVSQQKEQLQLQIQDEKQERRLIQQRISDIEQNLSSNLSNFDQNVIKQEQLQQLLAQQIGQKLQQQIEELASQISDAKNESELSLTKMQSSNTINQQLTCQIQDLKLEFNGVKNEMKNFVKSQIVEQKLMNLEKEIEFKFQTQYQNTAQITGEFVSQLKKQEQESKSLSELIEAENKANQYLKQQFDGQKDESQKQIFQIANQIDDQNKQINQIKESYEQSKKQSIFHQEILTLQIEFHLKAKQLPIVKPKLLKDDFWIRLFFVLQEKSKKTIKASKEIKLEGNNNISFWKACKNMGNLLIIFKSSSGYIFGGYSPCVWSSGSGYVQDDTLSSFIFLQTHNEIYPLKQDKKQNAIYCNASYGPTFGWGHDIYMPSNFNSGASNLGDTYYWDQYQNKSSSHLFGQQTSNVVECEIFELEFE